MSGQPRRRVRLAHLSAGRQAKAKDQQCRQERKKKLTVRLSVVVPRDLLDEGDSVPHRDQLLPARGEWPVVRLVDPVLGARLRDVVRVEEGLRTSKPRHEVSEAQRARETAWGNGGRTEIAGKYDCKKERACMYC